MTVQSQRDEKQEDYEKLLEKGNVKGAQLSGLECTSANWALMASNLILSWTARATLFLSNGSEKQAIADYSLISKSFLTFKCHLLSHDLTPNIRMFTFHTYVFVSPILRIGLGQSFGLSNRDHLLVPAARHRKHNGRRVRASYTTNRHTMGDITLYQLVRISTSDTQTVARWLLKCIWDTVLKAQHN